MQNQYSKKVRIISYHNAHNFGAILQAYGLQETLKKLGYTDVLFMHYEPTYLKNRYNPLSKKNRTPSHGNIIKKLKWLIGYLYFCINSFLRNQHFKKSIKRLLNQTSIKYDEYTSYVDETIDILICGSDQIWNCDITGKVDPIFFGKNIYKHLGYAISYAASSELSSISAKQNIEEIKSNLNNLKEISVREYQLKVILEQYTQKAIKTCIDPTLLAGSEVFNKIVTNRKIKDNYILIYSYDANDFLTQKVIQKIPNYNSFKQHIILLGPKTCKQVLNKNIHSAIYVEDFLSYFQQASYIVTNSFHGLAFSLLFNKNFNVTYAPGKENRCKSLLNQIDLMDRFIDNETTISWELPDYNKINTNIEKIRKTSLNYLINALMH